MLGYREPYDLIPYFWTEQFGVSLRYVGHTENWDTVEIDGSLDAQNCAVRYKQGGKIVAVATIGRNIQSLECEASMEASLQRRPRATHG